MDPITTAIIVGSAIAIGFLAYMMLYEQFSLRVRELDLSFPNLPEAFDGYTILHLSDLHVTKIGKLERRLMATVAGREVDTCFVTGDVTAVPRASDIFRRVCSTIPRRGLIYTVLGNSEHKPWLDTPMLVQALSFEGERILINSSTTISRGDGRIIVVGVDDPYSRLADLDAAFAGVDPEEFVIFLTHCPSTAPNAIEKGADLVLAGHTHGGQVRIPGIGMLWTHMRENQHLNDGLYTSERLKVLLRMDPGRSALFVHRGVGTSRFHIRFLCRPEVVYITLHRS